MDNWGHAQFCITGVSLPCQKWMLVTSLRLFGIYHHAYPPCTIGETSTNIFMALNLRGVQTLGWSAYIYMCNLVGSSCRKLSLVLCANICKERLRILGDYKQHISTIIHLLQEQSTVRRSKRGGLILEV